MMLALLLVLLLPVSGWAEEALAPEYPVYQGQPVVHCRMFLDKDLGYVMEGPGCPRHTLPACYQRMQEAMQLAEQHKFWPGYTLVEDGWYTEPFIPASAAAECDEECRLRKRLEELKENKRKAKVEANAKAQWNATMAECVRRK